MVQRLAEKGFEAIQCSSVSLIEKGHFRVVAIMNVLDRCEFPMTMLREAKDKVRDRDGIMIVAVVYPFRPWVENGANWFKGTDWKRNANHGNSM
jgi:2-polyprenyl-3-methyl-5-hydroxy-6-metoxy-1,4-benzoquinol methylase